MAVRGENVVVMAFYGAIYSLLLIPMMVTSFAGCSEKADKQEIEPGGVKLEMVSINGGAFDMGDSSSAGNADERPVHRVSISPFVMATYEVRYGDWQQVRDWATAHGYTFDNFGLIGDGDFGDTNHPVTKINWYDAVKWCNALSEMEERTPCYYTDEIDTVYRTGNVDIKENQVKWDANGYRLPTEAEWEYACRAGHSTQYAFGDSVDGSDANYLDSGDRYDNGTAPVGFYNANGYGLYDMHGNAWEWCWDWYDEDYYTESPANDPKGPLSGLDRVARGGGWAKQEVNLRSANRHGFVPDYKGNSVGFRPVRSD